MMMTLRKAPRRAHRKYAAREKCEAVLALWTERRTSTELCRQMGLSWTLLNNWEKLALEGMLTALEPKRQPLPATTAALSRRLEKLLAKKGQKSTTASPPNPSPAAKPVADLQAKARPDPGT